MSDKQTPWNTFRTEKNLERDGVRIDFGGYAITLARAGGANERWTKEVTARLLPHQRAVQAGAMDQELAKKLMIEAFVAACLVGWENIPDPDDESKDFPFTFENGVRLMTELPELYKLLKDEADGTQLFRRVVNEETAKN